MRKLHLSIIFFLVIFNSSSQSLKIAVISDTHYLSSKLAKPSLSLDKYEETTGRNIYDLHAILDKVFKHIISQQYDILLIPGDLTNNGEYESHIDFAQKFTHLTNHGIRVYVVPGNHDINVPNAKKYIGETAIVTKSISAQEFEEIYKLFGYSEAIKRDEASLSYLVALNRTTWLLCLDSNKYDENRTSPVTSGRIDKRTMNWAVEILQEAKSKGIEVLGMMHHGLVEHLPYQSTFFPQYLVDNWETDAETLANNGLKVIFTGHFHANDISLFTSSKDKTIYDIETGSLASYPFPLRTIELSNKTITLKTKFIDSIPKKENLQEEYKAKTAKLIRHVANSKLNSLSLPIPPGMRTTILDLLVEMQLQHMKGDEKINKEMRQIINQLNELLGNQDSDFSSFELDFPPADNFLEIEL